MLVTILVFRVLVIVVPVWAAWLILGGIFLLAGGFCWSRRTTKEAQTCPSHAKSSSSAPAPPG